ncbi:hypothetical protein ACLB2K_066983 [Fragaria x ananassa]
MAMARCSTAALILIVFSAALSSTVSGQVTGGRLVGGEAAWNSPVFDYQAWADGLTFHIGDELCTTCSSGVLGSSAAPKARAVVVSLETSVIKPALVEEA